MKDTGASSEMGLSLDNAGGTVFIRIAVPDLKVQKCLQFQLEQTVWQAKQRVLTSFAKDLKDALNYGLYLPPTNGRAGKYMEEERTLSEYPIQGPIGFLEFKYKRRVYKMMQISERKMKQINSKSKLKAFLDNVRSGNTAKINKLTLKGLDPNFHDPDSGETPLTTAVTLGRSKVREVIITLISGGAHLDFRNKQTMTALHRAAIVGNAEAIRTLLDLGASPNARDARDLTPLYYSVCNDDSNQECTYLLLHERASIGACDEQGWYEIHQACKYGRVQHLEHLLFYGADMDVRNSCGNTALHVCALNNQEACARVLLFRGADPNVHNYNNQTADQAASMTANTAIATMITSHNPDDVVPYREIPQFSDRRKGASLTPSLRALMRSRSDPRINMAGLDSRSTSASSSPRTGLVRKQNGHDWDSACSLSVSSSGSMAGASDQGFYDGKTTNGYGSINSMRKAGSMDHLDSISRAVNRYNTLGTLSQVDRVQKPRVVLLHRTVEGYGFVLRGAKSKLAGGGVFNDFMPSPEYPALQYLDSVDPGSQADRAGLKGGDYILEINGENVVRASHEHVVHLIRSSSDVLMLKVVTVVHSDRVLADWHTHADTHTHTDSGAMTLPTRKKLAAPLPPQRDPRTSLSYSKATSRSMAEGLAEIEKLDATIAQFDKDESLRRNSLHNVLKVPGARQGFNTASSHSASGSVSSGSQSGREFMGPAEARVKKYKKLSPQLNERSQSTPDLLAAVDHESAPFTSSHAKTAAPAAPSPNIYSTGQQSRDARLATISAMRGNPNISQIQTLHRRSASQMSDPSNSETAYYDSSDKFVPPSGVSRVQSNQNINSHYESSFRPGRDAQLMVHSKEDEQIKKGKVNGDKSISFADEKVVENTYKFLQKYPNATVLVTADIHTDRQGENKAGDLVEPEPDYNDIDDDKHGTVTQGPGSTQQSKMAITVISISSDNNKTPSSQSSPYSGSSTHSSPLPLHLTETAGRTSPSQSLSSSRRSSGVVMVTPSQDSSAESSRRSSIQSNLSGDFNEKNVKNSPVSSMYSTYMGRTEESSKYMVPTNTPPPPSAPPPPPPPPPPAMAGSFSSPDDGNTTLRRRINNPDAPLLPNKISKEDLLAAVIERQNRVETEGPRVSEVRTLQTQKSSIDLNQEALKAAIAKRKSRIETGEDQSLVHDIESRLNRNKKLQAVKYFGSNVSKYHEDESQSTDSESLKPEGPINVESTKQTLQVKPSPVVPVKSDYSLGRPLSEAQTNATQVGSGGNIDFRAHLKPVDLKGTKLSPATSTPPIGTTAISTKSSVPPAPVSVTSSHSSTLSAPPVEAKPNTLVTATPSVANTYSTADYIALAENARLEYLKKKAAGNLPPTVEKKGPVEITPNKKSPQKEMASSPVHVKMSHNPQPGSHLVTLKTNVPGVTNDYSHTEPSSLSNGPIKSKTSTPTPPAAFSSKMAAPPPPPPAFEDKSGLNNASKNNVFKSMPPPPPPINATQSAIRLSISDVNPPPPPPPPPPEFIDSFFDDQDAFIPPPPEFLEIDSNANESKTLDKNVKPFASKPISIWTCGDVQDWLDSQGFPQYRTSFAKSTVDGAKLIEMSRNDFARLGVSQSVHCINLETTVQKLNIGASTNL